MAVPNYSQGSLHLSGVVYFVLMQRTGDLTLSLYDYEDGASIPTAFVGLAGFVLVTTVHLTLLRRHLAWHFWGMYVGLLCTHRLLGSRES